MYYINSSKYGWRSLGDIFLIYKIVEMKVIYLNDTAKEIWEFILKSNTSVSKLDILNYFKKIYEADSDVIETDISSILDNMIALGVVETHS